MNDHFIKVKNYVLELGLTIKHQNESEGILVITDETEGVMNMALGIADSLLIMEQFIFEINGDNGDVYKNLLQKNRDIIHGAFVLDGSGTKVIFRDTLQLENLDLNELEGSINSLALLLMEYGDQILEFSKN